MTRTGGFRPRSAIAYPAIIAQAVVVLALLPSVGIARTSADPSWLQEDSTIPGTLNDLPPVPVEPLAEPRPTPADRAPVAPPVTPSSETLAPEALDALAPVWFTPESPEPTTSPAAPSATPIQPLDPSAQSPDAMDGVIASETPIEGDTASDASDASDAHIEGVDARGPFIIGPAIETPAPDPALTCAAARRDLALLAEAWPVYRDEQGRLRHQWARDPYRGARRYLDASARQAASASATQARDRDCPDAASPEAARAARATLLRAALCEAEQAELGALMALSAGAPAADAATLKRKRSVVTEVCATVQPSLTDAATATPTAVSSP